MTTLRSVVARLASLVRCAGIAYIAVQVAVWHSFYLAVPRDVVRGLPERLQELLGYNIYPPFVGYVDGRHPRKVL